MTLLDLMTAPAPLVRPQSDAATARERLRRVFESCPGQKLPMPWLRRQFPGSLTQRITELKRAGMHIENKSKRVSGSTHSVYIYTP